MHRFCRFKENRLSLKPRFHLPLLYIRTAKWRTTTKGRTRTGRSKSSLSYARASRSQPTHQVVEGGTLHTGHGSQAPSRRSYETKLRPALSWCIGEFNRANRTQRRHVPNPGSIWDSQVADKRDWSLGRLHRSHRVTLV